MGRWGGPDAAEVETVGVEAGVDGWVVVVVPVRVPGAREDEFFEGLVVEEREFFAQGGGIARAAQAVFGVVPIVFSA